MTIDSIAKTIEEMFPVPEHVADKVRHVVEKVKGGYILIEMRSPWDGSSGQWTKAPVAKIVYHKPSKNWRIYWMRASGRWERYPSKVKTLRGILKVIDKDEYGCFWG